MSTTAPHATLTAEAPHAGVASGMVDLTRRRQGPRPPDSDIVALRGIAFALILALPLWLGIAWLIALLV